MSGSRYAREPLLYIQQPKTEPPKAEMQTNYRSESRVKKVKKIAEAERNIFHDQLLSRKKRIVEDPSRVQEDALQEPLPAEEPASIIEIPDLQDTDQEIAFKDLDIAGKIGYLLNKPSHLPALKCEIRTEEGIQHGQIVAFQENVVHLKSKRQSKPKAIPFQAIQAIRLLGF